MGRTPGVLAGVLVTALVMAASASAYGTFAPAATHHTGAPVFGIAVADMNRDGNADILAGGDEGVDSPKNHISYFRGRGDGTFKKVIKIADLDGPEGIVTGRFNADKRPDFAVANYESNNIAIYLQKASGNFKQVQKIDDLAGPWLLQGADFDRDGRLDLVAGNYSGNGSNSATVFFGKARGKFRAGHDLPGAGHTSDGLDVGLLGPDKKPDFAVLDGNGTISVYRSRGDGTFNGPAVIANASSDPGYTGIGYGLAIGVFDQAFDDVAVGVHTTGDTNDHVHVAANPFQPIVPAVDPSPSPGSPNGIAAADFNLDGFDDLAVGRAADTGFNLLRSRGDATFALKPSAGYAGSSAAEWVAAGRLNHDKAPDVIVGTDSAIDVYINKKKK